MTLPTEKDSDTLLDSAPKIFKKSIILTIDRGLIFNEENPIWNGQFGTWHNCIALVHSEAAPLLHSWQMKVIFTSNQSQKTTPGAPLNSIMCDNDFYLEKQNVLLNF